MSLQRYPLDPIPDVTQKMAQKSFPKGTLAMRLRDALGPIYQDTDFAALFPKRGRGAEAPWRLALVTVLQMAENLSDLQAAEMVRARLDWKYALSLPLDDQGFDASILTDFRDRLVSHEAQELILEPILEVCRQRGWLKQAGGQQRIDSTMVLANARKLSSLESVGESLRVALNELADIDPQWVMGVVHMDWFDRYVHRFELQRFPKGKAAKEALLAQVGHDAWTLLHAAQQEGVPLPVREHASLVLLQRVWDQHYERVEGRIHWRDGPVVTNADRVVSPHDPQARESKKRQTEWLGYKVHLTETCDQEEAVHLIVHVTTTPATRQDVEETEKMLEDLERKQRAPREVFVDSGYVSGAIIANQRHKGREIIAPVLPDTTAQQRAGYGLNAFELSWEKQEAICPQGVTSETWRDSHGNRGEETIHVRFPSATCQACEVKARCTKSVKGGRTLTLYPRKIHETLQARRQEQTTEAFRRTYRRRSGIEGTLSEGVRAHGMRRSRYRGEEKTHLQMVSVASAMNLVRIDHMLQREKSARPPRRQRALSPFAMLREQMSA